MFSTVLCCQNQHKFCVDSTSSEELINMTLMHFISYFCFSSKPKHSFYNTPTANTPIKVILDPPTETSHPVYCHTGKMATGLLRLPLRLSMKNTATMSRNTILKTPNISKTTQIRTVISTPSGAILPKPEKVSIYLPSLPRVNRLET